MMPARVRPVLLVACLLAAAGAARADEVLQFRNGDRVTGHLIKREGGKIYFHSDLFGDFVTLDNLGSVIEASKPATPPESLAGLPPQPELKKLAPPPAAAPPPPPPSSGPAPAPAAPRSWERVALSRYIQPAGRLLTKPLEIFSVLKPWTGKVEFGYDNELTNVRTVNTNFRAEVDRSLGPNDYMIDAHYLNSFSGTTQNADQDGVDFRWRHHLNQRLFTQALSSYSRDRLRELHEDLDENVGLGYKLFENLRQTLDVGAGVIGQYLDVGGYQKGYDVLGSVFQDYTYKINGRFTLLESASAQYSPQERARFGLANGQTTGFSGRSQNYNDKFDATLQGKVSERLSLNLHFEYQYYSTILDSNARADQHITTTVGYSF